MTLVDFNFTILDTYGDLEFSNFLFNRFKEELILFAKFRQTKWFPYKSTIYKPLSVKCWNSLISYANSLYLLNGVDICSNVSNDIILGAKANEYGTSNLIAKPVLRPFIRLFNLKIEGIYLEFKELRQGSIK